MSWPNNVSIIDPTFLFYPNNISLGGKKFEGNQPTKVWKEKLGSTSLVRSTSSNNNLVVQISNLLTSFKKNKCRLLKWPIKNVKNWLDLGFGSLETMFFLLFTMSTMARVK